MRGESACFTDPSLELYTEFNTWCRERAEVYCINFKDPEHSDGWNCLKETVNPSTERVDPTRLNTFSSVFINKGNALFMTGNTKVTIKFVASRMEHALITTSQEDQKRNLEEKENSMNSSSDYDDFESIILSDESDFMYLMDATEYASRYTDTKGNMAAANNETA